MVKKTLLKRLEELGCKNKTTVIKFPVKKMGKIKERFELELE